MYYFSTILLHESMQSFKNSFFNNFLNVVGDFSYKSCAFQKNTFFCKISKGSKTLKYFFGFYFSRQ